MIYRALGKKESIYSETKRIKEGKREKIKCNQSFYTSRHEWPSRVCKYIYVKPTRKFVFRKGGKEKQKG